MADWRPGADRGIVALLVRACFSVSCLPLLLTYVPLFHCSVRCFTTTPTTGFHCSAYAVSPALFTLFHCSVYAVSLFCVHCTVFQFFSTLKLAKSPRAVCEENAMSDADCDLRYRTVSLVSMVHTLDLKWCGAYSIGQLW